MQRFGEEATIEQIAEELNNQTTWIKSAEIIKGETSSGDSIIVTLLDGNIFQVYYDSLYGQINISHVGTTKEGQTEEEIMKEIPKVQAELDSNGNIVAKIELERGKLSEVQLIYGENIIDTKQITGNSAEVTFEDAEKNGQGWYEVKAITSTGKSGVAWIRIATISNVPLPTIEISPLEPNGENGWYVTPVTVKAISNDSTVTKMHYTISTTGEADPIDGKEVTLPTFNESGIYTIVVWAEDGSGNVSGGVIQNIKVDLNNPEITHLDITKGDRTSNDNEWIVTDGEVTVTANDNGGGKLKGYEYEVLDYTDNTKVIKAIDGVHDMTETISIKTDGEYKINVKAVDEAGNRSEVKEVTVKKDSVKPIVTINSVTDETSSGFTVKSTAGDDTSKIQRLEVHTVNGSESTVVKTIYEVKDIVVDTLDSGTEYTIFVRAYDNAGNYQDSASTSVTTTTSLGQYKWERYDYINNITFEYCYVRTEKEWVCSAICAGNCCFVYNVFAGGCSLCLEDGTWSVSKGEYMESTLHGSGWIGSWVTGYYAGDEITNNYTMIWTRMLSCGSTGAGPSYCVVNYHHWTVQNRLDFPDLKTSSGIITLTKQILIP